MLGLTSRVHKGHDGINGDMVIRAQMEGFEGWAYNVLVEYPVIMSCRRRWNANGKHSREVVNTIQRARIELQGLQV